MVHWNCGLVYYCMWYTPILGIIGLTDGYFELRLVSHGSWNTPAHGSPLPLARLTVVGLC